MNAYTIILLFIVTVCASHSSKKPTFDVVKACSEKIEAGPCTNYVYRYAYDKRSNTCFEFMWGGCPETINYFETRAECTEYCVKEETN